MADTPDKTTTAIDTSMDGTQTEVAREPEPEKAKVFTQADVDAAAAAAAKARETEVLATLQPKIDSAVQQRLARERRKPNGKKDDNAQTTTADDSPDQTPPGARSEVDSFMWHAHKQTHLTDRQLRTMEEAWRKDQPTHGSEWMAEYMTDMGWKPPTSPAQHETAKPGDEAKLPNGVAKKPNPAAIDNTATAGASSWKQIQDPTQLSREQIDAMYVDLGVRKAQQAIRSLWEKWGKTVRITPG
jgi:hypothetical protein